VFYFSAPHIGIVFFYKAKELWHYIKTMGALEEIISFKRVAQE